MAQNEFVDMLVAVIYLMSELAALKTSASARFPFRRHQITSHTLTPVCHSAAMYGTHRGSIFNVVNVRSAERRREIARERWGRTQTERPRHIRRETKAKTRQWYSQTGCEAVRGRCGGEEAGGGGGEGSEMSWTISNEGPCGNCG